MPNNLCLISFSQKSRRFLDFFSSQGVPSGTFPVYWSALWDIEVSGLATLQTRPAQPSPVQVYAVCIFGKVSFTRCSHPKRGGRMSEWMKESPVSPATTMGHKVLGNMTRHRRLRCDPLSTWGWYGRLSSVVAVIIIAKGWREECMMEEERRWLHTEERVRETMLIRQSASRRRRRRRRGICFIVLDKSHVPKRWPQQQPLKCGLCVVGRGRGRGSFLQCEFRLWVPLAPLWGNYCELFSISSDLHLNIL